MLRMNSLRRHFIDQLRQRLLHSAESARRVEAEARESARTVATESEKKADARMMLEYGSLAKGHAARARKAQERLHNLDALIKRGIIDFKSNAPIDLGAIVDVATLDENGPLERTFIMLPVGAATELEGPGGDGFITVLTPVSPVGRALMGKQAGDFIEVAVKGEDYTWEIIEVG